MIKRLLFQLTRHALLSSKLRMGLCMLLLTICGAAASAQPVMISTIEIGSKNFVNINGRLYFSSSANLYSGTSSASPTLVKNTGENIIGIYDNKIAGKLYFTVNCMP